MIGNRCGQQQLTVGSVEAETSDVADANCGLYCAYLLESAAAFPELRQQKVSQHYQNHRDIVSGSESAIHNLSANSGRPRALFLFGPFSELGG